MSTLSMWLNADDQPIIYNSEDELQKSLHVLLKNHDE